jgi:hypothetical protein
MWGGTRRAGVGCTCLRIIAIMLPAPCSRSPHPVTYLQRDAKPSRSFAAVAGITRGHRLRCVGVQHAFDGVERVLVGRFEVLSAGVHRGITAPGVAAIVF